VYRRLWLRIEVLPDEELLWRVVNKADQVYKNGRPKPSFFRDSSGLSCDLARFSTPARSCAGYGERSYPPESGLVEMTTILVREAGSDVTHRPVTTPTRNYAHAQLVTLLPPEGREMLAKKVVFRVPHRFRQS
jgi:hypothetical protein